MTTLRVAVFSIIVAACGAKQTNPSPDPGTSPTPPPAGSATAPSGGGGGGGAVGDTCGGLGGPTCGANLFCNYTAEENCGATDAPGHCAAKPAACPRIVMPVCGCDGKTYNNGCEALQASVAVKSTGGGCK